MTPGDDTKGLDNRFHPPYSNSLFRVRASYTRILERGWSSGIDPDDYDEDGLQPGDVAYPRAVDPYCLFDCECESDLWRMQGIISRSSDESPDGQTKCPCGFDEFCLFEGTAGEPDDLLIEMEFQLAVPEKLT